MTDLRKIERALVSVSDKTGIVEFARSLAGFGVEIISTGGTAMTLRGNGIDVTDVSDMTGFPEMMDGRVKTLHPKIHGALLALRDNEEHVTSMKEYDIKPIDMVVVNLYPFEQTVVKEGVTLDEVIENIDIGGPAMIRSAAKNYRDVAVVSDPVSYPQLLEELGSTNGSLTIETRRRLAIAAYSRTAAYDRTISNYLDSQLKAKSFPDRISFDMAKAADLRYGENPHQKAALYTDSGSGLADGTRPVLRRLLAPGADRNIGALARQFERNRLADATGTAGHDGDLALKG